MAWRGHVAGRMLTKAVRKLKELDGPDWIHLAQNGNKFWALLKTNNEYLHFTKCDKTC
jgi:predicted metal-binding protein